MSKVLVCGTFDLLHSGHIALFKEAAKMGEVIVIVNTDDFPMRFKGKQTIMNLKERMETISAIKYVSVVDVNIGSEDMKPIIEKYNPDIILRGSDWSDDNAYLRQLGVTMDYINAKGITLACIPYHTGISTTQIKERIKLLNENNANNRPLYNS